MRTPDYKAHNEEVARVWAAFEKGSPERVPMTLGINPRYYMPIAAVNTQGISFREYTEDPAIMMDFQCRCEEYRRLYIPADWEMGLPDSWTVHVDFQNYYDAAWWGCPVVFISGNVPDTRPILTDDNKHAILDGGILAPDARIMGKAVAYMDKMEQLAKTYTYLGRPVKLDHSSPLLSFDGPMTVACNIRGASQFAADLIEDPDFADQLLALITEATIARISYWRKAMGLPVKSKGYGFADDSIALLSPKMYRERILPHHRKMVEALADGPCSIHLCGDSSRHFKTIHDELNVNGFDTGYPIDHAATARLLGPKVGINGGPHVELLRTGSAEEVKAECRRILRAVKPYCPRFVIREANNLPPGVPLENLWAMYDTVHEEA